jgi:glycogen(starch) synthase
VVAAHSSLEMPDDSEFAGVPVYRFRFVSALAERDLSLLADTTRRLADVLRSFQPDLLHVNYWEPSLFFHRRVAAVAPAPLLVSFRGPPPEPGDRQDTVFGQAMRAATWVTAVSESALQRVRALAPDVTSRSSVIRNGLEMPALAPAPLPWAPPRVACVGRLVPEKGFDLALRALARLTTRFPALRLTLVGDGPERPRLEALARELGLGNAVTFLGWLPPPQVPAVMNGATLVVVPSRWEGLPGVAIQAAQMARPAVATRVGGIPEIVLDGETGLLVEPDDVPALAEAIARVLESPNRAAEMGRAARRHARAAFDWRRYLDAHDALYRRLTPTIPNAGGGTC